MTNSTGTDNVSRQQIALTYLRFSREDALAADTNEAVGRRVRLHYVRLARDYGVTLKAIGEALGLTESAVRFMLAKEDQ